MAGGDGDSAALPERQGDVDPMAAEGSAGMAGSAMRSEPGMRSDVMQERGEAVGMDPTGPGSGSDGGGGGGGGDDPSTRPVRRCAAMDVHHRLLATSEEYRAARAIIEEQTRALTSGARAMARTGVARIPVVVHVLWNANAQN